MGALKLGSGNFFFRRRKRRSFCFFVFCLFVCFCFCFLLFFLFCFIYSSDGWFFFKSHWWMKCSSSKISISPLDSRVGLNFFLRCLHQGRFFLFVCLFLFFVLFCLFCFVFSFYSSDFQKNLHAHLDIKWCAPYIRDLVEEINWHTSPLLLMLSAFYWLLPITSSGK